MQLLGDLNGYGFLRWGTLSPNSDENIDIILSIN
jgi:hypothetical protein